MSESPLLSVERRADREPTAISISGELDLSSAGLLHATFADGVDRSATVVLECAGLTFVDSSGLSALLTETKAMREAGGHLLLGSIEPPVARVIKLAGLDEVLEFVDGREGACSPT